MLSIIIIDIKYSLRDLIYDVNYWRKAQRRDNRHT